MVSKASVDRALQKYAQLLRQMQALSRQQQPQQEQNLAVKQEQQQQQQIVEQQRQRIVQLENALQRQQTITKTALEIKAVELDICAREGEQKALQVQQLSWKLAKERTTARDKADARRRLEQSGASRRKRRAGPAVADPVLGTARGKDGDRSAP